MDAAFQGEEGSPAMGEPPSTKQTQTHLTYIQKGLISKPSFDAGCKAYHF